jgi:prolyl 4-hydroxylase
MAWVDASDDLAGGATEFPLLRRQESKDWCRYVECNYSVHEKEHGKEGAEGQGETGAGTAREREKDMALTEGVKFKVVPGNAVFWVNFDGRREGVRESWHAGLPVERGRKVGLNIWSFGRIE